VELSLFGPHLCDVDVEEADRVALELLLRRLDTFDVRQAAAASTAASLIRLPGPVRLRLIGYTIKPAGRRRVFLATADLLRCSPVMMAKRRNWETGSRVGGRTESRPGGFLMP
jgi:hypothetical protein